MWVKRQVVMRERLPARGGGQQVDLRRSTTGDGCSRIRSKCCVGNLFTGCSWRPAPHKIAPASRYAVGVCVNRIGKAATRRSGERWTRASAAKREAPLRHAGSGGSHISNRSADPFSSFAGEGGDCPAKTPGWREAPDGVWPAAATVDWIARPSARAFNEPSLLSAPHPALRATFPALRRRRRATARDPKKDRLV